MLHLTISCASRDNWRIGEFIAHFAHCSSFTVIFSRLSSGQMQSLQENRNSLRSTKRHRWWDGVKNSCPVSSRCGFDSRSPQKYWTQQNIVITACQPLALSTPKAAGELQTTFRRLTSLNKDGDEDNARRQSVILWGAPRILLRPDNVKAIRIGLYLSLTMNRGGKLINESVSSCSRGFLLPIYRPRWDAKRNWSGRDPNLKPRFRQGAYESRLLFRLH